MSKVMAPDTTKDELLHTEQEEAAAAAAAQAELSAAQAELSAAQRARIERNRLKARALRDARLVQRPPATLAAPDSGGGFLPDADEPEPPRALPPPAPIADPAEQPRCLDCDRLFPQSYLFDTFGYNVCDECRDDEGEHALITRTEAKSAYLLKDCDLDLRPPALRCVRRRNPHARRGDMRLYVRAQVAARAREAWGSAAALEAERARRAEAKARATQTATARRLRALRMDVRSSLFAGARAAHEHEFGAEQYDADADLYSRACACGHVETYEKM
nr:DNA repair protein complementing XP-A cells homolog isoform X3 [Helicoverpa armigera]XP_049692362.1 DNA repair protein complementing XP-A cells homolog isoform X4 [Helicoverpa armigera]